MIPVSSDNLVSVGYDRSTSTLRIEFKSGLYDYHNVPEHIYNNLMNASSKGGYHHQFIKNDYPYTRIY